MNRMAPAKDLEQQRSLQLIPAGVIVATGYGYQRPDGVAVIPIGALGPSTVTRGHRIVRVALSGMAAGDGRGDVPCAELSSNSSGASIRWSGSGRVMAKG